VFKKINKSFQGEIVPLKVDKILWQMLKNRKINMYLSTAEKDKDDPMIITTEKIKGGKILT
jgi:hypothetical protein